MEIHNKSRSSFRTWTGIWASAPYSRIQSLPFNHRVLRTFSWRSEVHLVPYLAVRHIYVFQTCIAYASDIDTRPNRASASWTSVIDAFAGWRRIGVNELCGGEVGHGSARFPPMWQVRLGIGTTLRLDAGAGQKTGRTDHPEVSRAVKARSGAKARRGEKGVCGGERGCVHVAECARVPRWCMSIG